MNKWVSLLFTPQKADRNKDANSYVVLFAICAIAVAAFHHGYGTSYSSSYSSSYIFLVHIFSGISVNTFCVCLSLSIFKIASAGLSWLDLENLFWLLQLLSAVILFVFELVGASIYLNIVIVSFLKGVVICRYFYQYEKKSSVLSFMFGFFVFLLSAFILLAYFYFRR